MTYAIIQSNGTGLEYDEIFMSDNLLETSIEFTKGMMYNKDYLKEVNNFQTSTLTQVTTRTGLVINLIACMEIDTNFNHLDNLKIYDTLQDVTLKTIFGYGEIL